MEKLWEDPYKDGILEMKKHQKPCAVRLLGGHPPARGPRLHKWYLELVQLRALRLWKGEQVDGTVMEPWGWPEFPDEPKYILGLPSAVMAGWRYLTSLETAPRMLCAPMHWSLLNKGS